MKEHEIELIDYLRVLWRQKWVIAATLITAVAVSWGASQATTPTYQTRTSLLLLPPLSSQLDAEAVGSRLAPEAVRELAVSTSLLEIVKETTGLSERVQIDTLKGRFGVSVRRLSSDSGGSQFLLDATIEGPDPERLPEIAAAWTEAFAEKFGELFQDRTARSYTYVSANYAETEAELERLVEQRTNLLLEHPISILQAELAALQLEETENQSRLVAAHLEYNTTMAQVAALERELAEQPLFYSLKQGVNPDSLVAALGAGLSAREVETLMNVQVESEHLNDTYVSLNTLVSTRRVAILELEEEILRREENAIALRPELVAKQRELTETQAAQDDIDRRTGILQTALVKLAANLQDAQLALAETPEPIRVIDEPLVPRHPIAPKKTANIAIAGFLGLMLGTLLAFFVDYISRVREQESIPKPMEKADSDSLRDQRTYEETQIGRAENGEKPPPPSQ